MWERRHELVRRAHYAAWRALDVRRDKGRTSRRFSRAVLVSHSNARVGARVSAPSLVPDHGAQPNKEGRVMSMVRSA